jgi:hypothetical protein
LQADSAMKLTGKLVKLSGTAHVQPEPQPMRRCGESPFRKIVFFLGLRSGVSEPFKALQEPFNRIAASGKKTKTCQ